MKALIIFVLTIFLANCSTSIKLNSHLNINKQYFILKLEKADLYFLKEDVLLIAETDEARGSITMNRGEYDQILRRVKDSQFDTLSFPIRRDDTDGSVRSNAHMLLSLSYIELIDKWKFLALNKSSMSFENEILVKKIRSKSGSRFAYLFHNGQEFYSDITSITD